MLESLIHSLSISLKRPGAWADRALCAQAKHKEVFHPERGQSANHARRVCGMCPVAFECLMHAIANNEEHGIWGGATYTQRMEIKNHPLGRERVGGAFVSRLQDWADGITEEGVA